MTIHFRQGSVGNTEHTLGAVGSKITHIVGNLFTCHCAKICRNRFFLSDSVDSDEIVCVLATFYSKKYLALWATKN